MHSHTESSKEFISKDELFNQNCYRYLQALGKIELTPTQNLNLDTIKSLVLVGNTYHRQIMYGNIYLEFMTSMSEWCESEENLKKIQSDKNLRKFIIAIYENDNNNLNHTYNAISSLVHDCHPGENAIPKIREGLQQLAPYRNQQAPSHTSSRLEMTLMMLRSDYKPLNKYSLPTVRGNTTGTTEIRIPTQVERHQNSIRLHPIFRAYLQAKQVEKQKHLYINLLPRTQSLLHRYFTQETLFTETLESTENVDLVSVPLDMKSMKKQFPKSATLAEVKSNMLAPLEAIKASLENKIALLKSSELEPSETMRASLENNQNLLDKLNKIPNLEIIAKNIFRKGPNQTLSQDELSAICFHYYHYTLPMTLLAGKEYNTFNISCKDAIDRGAVSSGYLNLIYSIENKTAFTEQQLDTALFAPSTMVKGREINFYFKLHWNALDQYCKANPEKVRDNTNFSWIPYWLDKHCPKEYVSERLHARMNELNIQGIDLFKDYKDPVINNNPATKPEQSVQTHEKNSELITQYNQITSELKAPYYKIINEIENQIKHGTNGQELLLEALSLTSMLVKQKIPTKPSSQAAQSEDRFTKEDNLHVTNQPSPQEQYKDLIQRMKKDNSRFKILTGLLQTFLGLVSKHPITNAKKGIAKMRAGFFAGERKKIIDAMEKVETFGSEPKHQV